MSAFLLIFAALACSLSSVPSNGQLTPASISAPTLRLSRFPPTEATRPTCNGKSRSDVSFHATDTRIPTTGTKDDNHD